MASPAQPLPISAENLSAVESLNVEFDGGAVLRRRGRSKLIDTVALRPTKILYYDGVATVSDVTALLTDGDKSSSGLANAFDHTTSRMAIGCPHVFAGVSWFFNAITSTNTASAIALTYGTLRRSASALGIRNQMTGADGTVAGGFFMKQNGAFAIDLSAGGLVDWDTGCGVPGGDVTTPAAMTTAMDQDLYWLYIIPTVAFTGMNIAEIAITLQGSDLSLRTESAGMAEFVTRSGDRQLISTNEFPGRYNDAVVSSYAIPYSNLRASYSRLWKYDLSRGDIVPLRLPPFLRGYAYPGKPVSYQVFNGWLIGATSGGFLWKYDGNDIDRLEAVVGNDALNNVSGAQGYLAQPPRGTLLEVYHNKLMVAGDPSSPLAFYGSIEDNNIEQIPTSATVGGPNVWPLRYAYTVPGRAGDVIVGASVINDRYVILTRQQTWVFDESSIRMIDSDVGCVAPGSVQRIDNRLFFLSDRGVYVSDGSGAVNIAGSGYIAEVLSKVVHWRHVEFASSAHYKTKAEYWLWLPVNGEARNQIAIVYNYNNKTWRVVSGWYPWDVNGRRDGNSIVHSVTASAEAMGSDGRQALLSVDADGILWNEDRGYDDDGKVYPAYIALPSLNPGENFRSYRDWYLSVDMDGQWMECLALADGERLDQELDRRFSNLSTNSEIVAKQALQSNAVSPQAQDTFGSVTGWPVSGHFARVAKLKFSFGRHLTKMRPVIHWAPGQLAPNFQSFMALGVGSPTGAYVNAAPGQAAVHDMQFGTEPLGSGR